FSMGSYLLHAVHVLPGVGLFGIGGVGVFNIHRDGEAAASLTRAGEGDALGVPPGAGDLVDGGAYDPALLHDDKHFVVILGHERSHEVAARLDDVGDLDPEPAAVLHPVFTQRRAFGVAALGVDEQVGVVGDDVHGEEGVPLAELHPDEPVGRPPGGPERRVGRGEAQRLALVGDEDDVLTLVGELRGDELVGRAALALAQPDRDDSAGAR